VGIGYGSYGGGALCPFKYKYPDNPAEIYELTLYGAADI